MAQPYYPQPLANRPRQVRKTRKENYNHAHTLTDEQLVKSLTECPITGGCAGCDHIREVQELRRKQKQAAKS